MNESLKLGMSIMENYFEKLDANSNQDDLDEDEDEEENEDKEKNKDIAIYEAKDPYVLRSLPYLIGSQLYMENDHIGLKDLESEDEAESEEVEEDEEEVEKDESDESSESEKNEDENDETDEFSKIQNEILESKKTSTKFVKKETKTDLFDSLSEEDDEDNDIFNSKKATVINYFFFKSKISVNFNQNEN
jgi:hypothetical protein